MDDDAKLLQLYVREHSERAFAELVHRHLRAVYAVVLRRVGGDVHLAQEATQDVFTALSRKAASLTSKPSLAGWLFVSARFASAKIVRREQRKRALLLDEALLKLTPASEAEPNWSELRPLVDTLIQNLNTADREALLLRFYEDRSFAEIGDLLRLSENTARMRVSRAVEKLREKLLRKGIASTGVALAAGLSEQASASVPASLPASVVSTAVATGAVLSSPLFVFMALTKTQTVVLAALIAGAAFVGVEQHRNIAALRTQLTAEETDLRATKKQLRETADKLAVSENARHGAVADKLPPKPAANSSFGSQDVVVLHLKDVIRQHPEMAALQRRQKRESLLVQYSAGLQQLHLSRADENKLKDLLMERAASMEDAEEVAAESGAKQDSPEMHKAVSDAAAPLDQAVKALIGTAAADKLETLRGTIGFSQTATSIVAINLLDAQQPLTTEQSAALEEAYYESRSSGLNPETKDPAYNRPDPKSWLSQADTNFLNKAAGILAPDQIETAKAALADHNHFTNIIDQYNKNHKAMMIVP
jgi:RNA polymerase sigma factor (sigma-70 family)